MELKSEQLWSLVLPRLRSYRSTDGWDIGLVARMTGSTNGTVIGWLNGQIPAGERLIKLWHLLAALGYESPELAQLSPFSRYCGELLTFEVISLKDVQDICQVVKPQSALLALRGKPTMRPQFTFEELVELHGDELQMKMAAVAVDGPVAEDSGHRQSVSQTQVPFLDGDSDDLIVYAASLLKAALPLTRRLNSEQVSPKDRSTLRELVGHEDLFELSNTLNDLCSERARNHGRTGQ